MDIVNKLQDIVNQFLHNPVCWNCGLSHNGSKLICAPCESAILHVQAPCKQCGLSHNGLGEICIRCLTTPKLWQTMVAPLSYKKPISHSIQLLKFNQKLEVLRSLVELVEPTFSTLHPMPQLLIPVPLHQNRYRQRGYNQSYEIALILSKALGVPCSDHYAERIIDTPRQSDLKLKQREKNIKNAFLVDDAIGQYQHIAIIDDVVTTGSTVHELTKHCLRNGVKTVDVWAIARTELKPS